MRTPAAAYAAAAALLTGLVAASSLTPPVLPLTVRTPYMSTWLNDAREEPWSRWPMFWTGDEVCTLAIRRALGGAMPRSCSPHADILDSTHADHATLPNRSDSRYSPPCRRRIPSTRCWVARKIRWLRAGAERGKPALYSLAECSGI